MTVQYAYDKAGRMTSINPASTTYDVAISWNDASLRTQLDNAEVDYDFVWDDSKRLDSLTATFGSFSRVVDFAYDAHDRLETLTYPSGREVVYAYDTKGRVSSITTTGATDYLSSITYKAHGGVDTITYGNGATSAFSYDTRFRPTTLATQGPDLTVDYDPASRIDSWATTGGVARSFGYDEVGRLTSGTGPRGESISITYTNGGNRLTQTIDGVVDTYGYTSDRLTSVTGGNPETLGYDTAGRLTSRTGSTFTWSPLDRMVSATISGTPATYGYDGDGYRVKATVGGATRHFVHDGSGRILAEYDGAGNLLIEHIYLGDRRVASRQANGTRSYVQHDLLGSSWIVTQNSSAGQYAIWDYWPFGDPVSQFDLDAGETGEAPEALCTQANPVFCDGFESGNLLAWSCTNGQSACPEPGWALFEPLFTGKKLDTETKLFYFEARHMDPKLGRFTSPDQGPFVLENPQTFNRYAYAVNSPLTYIDPTGRAVNFVFDFTRSSISPDIQQRVMAGIQAVYQQAGLVDVSVYTVADGFQGDDRGGKNATIFLTYQDAPLEDGAFGVTGRINPGTSERSNRSIIALAGGPKDDIEALVNFLINVGAHEGGHGSQGLKKYNRDSSPLGEAGEDATTMQNFGVDKYGLARKWLSRQVYQFSSGDAEKLRKEHNP